MKQSPILYTLPDTKTTDLEVLEYKEKPRHRRETGNLAQRNHNTIKTVQIYKSADF